MAYRIVRPDSAFENDRSTKRRPRVHDNDFLGFVRSLPCIVTGAQAEAAHIRFASALHGKPSTGMGTRPDDRWVVPLSPPEHRLNNDCQHSGSEMGYWQRKNIDPVVVSALIFSHFHADDQKAALLICRHARLGSFPWPALGSNVR